MSFKATTASTMTNASAFPKTAELLDEFLKEQGINDVNVSVRKWEKGDQVRTHYTGVEVDAEKEGVTHIFSFGDDYYEVGVNSNDGSLHYDSYGQGNLDRILNQKDVSDGTVALLKQIYGVADVVKTSKDNGVNVEVDTVLLDDEGNLMVDLVAA